MKIRNWMIVLLLFVFVAGCNGLVGEATPTSVPEATATSSPTLPPPDQKTTPVPDPDRAVQAYLDAWKADDYGSMYAMLTKVSQDAISEEEFTQWYTNIGTQAAVSGVDYELLSSFVQSTRSAQASYRVTLQSVLVGDITRDTVMNLSLEDGEWRVQWADNLVLPELAGGNYFWMDRQIPARANIYDQDGNALVAYADAVSVGIIPGKIPPDEEGKVLSEVQWLTGLKPDAVRLMYADFPIGVDWYLPLMAVPLERVEQRYDVTNGYDDRGLVMYPFSSRFYFDGGLAAQAIGYVSYIQAAEKDEFLRKGYQQDEKVGRQGIEAWGEPYLGGNRGGTLYVVNPNGDVVTQ